MHFFSTVSIKWSKLFSPFRGMFFVLVILSMLQFSCFSLFLKMWLFLSTNVVPLKIWYIKMLSFTCILKYHVWWFFLILYVFLFTIYKIHYMQKDCYNVCQKMQTMWIKNRVSQHNAFRISEQLLFTRKMHNDLLLALASQNIEFLWLKWNTRMSVVYLPFDSSAGNLVKWAMSLD